MTGIYGGGGSLLGERYVTVGGGWISVTKRYDGVGGGVSNLRQKNVT